MRGVGGGLLLLGAAALSAGCSDRAGGAQAPAAPPQRPAVPVGVATAEQKEIAAARAMDLQGARRVVNEIAIGEPPGNWQRGTDSTLTGRVKAALLGIDLPEFDASRVNVTSVRGEVYLMGLVRRSEAQAAVDVVRGMRGVARVVKVFEYLD